MYKENETTELKREVTRDLTKEIVAFLNTSGGVVYIGVGDNGEVVGVNEPSNVMDQISSMVHDNIRPDAKGFIHISVNEDNVIVIIILEGTNKPYYIQGKGLKPEGVYVRLGTSSVPSSEEGIKKMLLSTIAFSYEETVAIHQELSFNTLENAMKLKNLVTGPTQFKSLKMVNQFEQYTNLGLLLSDQCTHSIKVAVFDSDEPFKFLDRREFTGSLFKILEETLEYLHLCNHLEAYVEGYQRKEQRDYPPEIIREGVINGIVHRDYSFSGPILIGVYSNRMEIISLGGLASGLSIHDIQLGVSQARNKYLSNIFYRLGYVEAYGTGLKKITKHYEAYLWNELVQVTENGFKLTLWNDNKKAYSSKKEVKETKGLYDIEQDQKMKQLVAYLSNHKEFNRLEVQGMLGIGQTKAGLLLAELISRGIIVKIGKGKLTTYRVV